MLLYTQVVDKLQDEDDVLTGSDCSKISMMSGEQSENIFLLIVHYSHLHDQLDEALYKSDQKSEKDRIVDSIYKYRPVTKTGLGAKFYLSHVPEELQRIIKCYLRLISC